MPKDAWSMLKALRKVVKEGAPSHPHPDLPLPYLPQVFVEIHSPHPSRRIRVGVVHVQILVHAHGRPGLRGRRGGGWTRFYA